MKIGNLKNKDSMEILSSNLSIGCETLDRDFQNYHNYKEYLYKTGAKRARIQTGWGKIESKKGEYDFLWLDEIVDDMLAHGIQPWLELNYGNLLYEGGGGITLADDIIRSEEALTAWDSWVEAMVSRYCDRVLEWEVWNEPDLSKRFTVEEYAAFYIRTAKIIKRVCPKARIIAIAMCCPFKTDYLERFLEICKENDALSLISIVSLHGYVVNPDEDISDLVFDRELIDQYIPGCEVWQGETGAPSQNNSWGALRDWDANELTQAKHNARRCLATIGNDMLFNMFTIANLHYPERVNSKGLLETNSDMTIKRPKLAYHTFQNITAIFTGDLKRDKHVCFTSNQSLSMQLFKYTNMESKSDVIVYWDKSKIPMKETPQETCDVKVLNCNIKNPILIDIISGEVFKINEPEMKCHHAAIFEKLPFYDYPMVIADESILK